MAGAITTLALNTALSAQLDLRNPASWVPPLPQAGTWEALALTASDELGATVADYETGPVAAPPLPPIVPNVVEVDTANAFGADPFDANGCPILSPTDLQALATLPYRDFAAISAPEDALPPLPEGFDVMPLAQGSGIFVETEDVFRFRAISTNNSVPVSFFGRVQRPSGYIIPFNHTLTTSTANTTFTTQPVPGKGILLGAAASVPIGSITSGAVNAVGEIGRVQGGTFTPHTLLFSGQLDDLYPLTTEGGGLPTPAGRPTFLSVNSAAAVASPKSVTITPSAGKRVRLTAVFYTLTTTGAAGDRSPWVGVQIAGVRYLFSLAGLNVGPGSAANVYASMGNGNSLNCPAALSAGIPVPIGLPESLYFYDAFDVFMAKEGGVAGDTIGSALIRYEES